MDLIPSKHLPPKKNTEIHGIFPMDPRFRFKEFIDHHNRVLEMASGSLGRAEVLTGAAIDVKMLEELHLVN